MLTLKSLTKIYPARRGEYSGGIRNAEIDLAPGTFFTLLGPSGCGKTTTLRCIAGLETPDAGTITVDGKALFDKEKGISVPLHRRNIGMVFQSYAIWPHMTVFENVSFPMRVSKAIRYSRDEIREAVGVALESVGLGGYANRSATQLSGGQQQRVALARAIVHRPKLLLLDEPLSNLDAALREEMRGELKRLQRELGITAVYVTHDQTEALAMSDVISVINKGRIVQTGAPRDIYFRPADEFVAGFIGHTNILNGTMAPGTDPAGLRRATLADGSSIGCKADADLGPEVALSIRPEDIRLESPSSPSTNGENAVPGTVTAASFLGNVVHYDIRSASLARVFRVEGAPGAPVDTGTEVIMRFRAQDAIAISKDI